MGGMEGGACMSGGFLEERVLEFRVCSLREAC